MKYLKKFETHAEYEAYKNSQDYITPNVSWCLDNNEVHFNKYIKPEPVFALKFIPTSPNEEEIVIGCEEIEDGLLDAGTITDNIGFDLNGSVIIGNCVTSIDGGTFEEISGVTSITIPNSVTSIGNEAFMECSDLTTITIPRSVTSIGYGILIACGTLSSIVVESNNMVYDSRNNCNAIIETATNTLIMGCNNTVIPDNVTQINREAFNGLSGLSTITIPNSVTSIGKYAFFYCRNLNSITCLATTPPTLFDNQVFGETNNCPIYVPAESVNAYKSATNWTTYASRIQAIPTT